MRCLGHTHCFPLQRVQKPLTWGIDPCYIIPEVPQDGSLLEQCTFTVCEILSFIFCVRIKEHTIFVVTFLLQKPLLSSGTLYCILSEWSCSLKGRSLGCSLHFKPEARIYKTNTTKYSCGVLVLAFCFNLQYA